MAEKRRVKKYDTDLVSLMLFLLTFCIIAVVFSLKDGSDVMFYAGFPMLTSAVASAFSMICVEEFTAEQTRKRIFRKKYADAVALFFCVMRFALFCALLTFVLFYVFAGILGKSILGNSLFTPVFQVFTPAFVLLPFLGAMKGFLRGIGTERAARGSLWLFTALFFMFGMVLGLVGAHRGDKVGALLRNDDMGAVYCACGIGTGLTVAAIASMIFLGVVTFLAVRGLQRSHRYRQEDLFFEGQREDRREQFRYCTARLLPGFGPALILLLVILIGYRMWLGSQNLRPALVVSMWGGFIGVGLPICTGLGLLFAMPFTHLVMTVVRAYKQGKGKLMRVRLLLALRLSAYMGIPASAFLFGAAKEAAGIFTGLTFKAEEAAVLSLKAGSFLIFLIQTVVLVLTLYWKCGARRIVLISGGAAFFAGIVTQILLNAAGVGITVNVWPLAVMGVVFLLFLYFLGKSSILGGMGTSFLTEDIRIAVCAAGAVIPLELLNDYLLMVLPAVIAFLVMLGVFWILYVVLSIFLRAADLRNLHRIPGGSWILDLAVLLGAAEGQ